MFLFPNSHTFAGQSCDRKISMGALPGREEDKEEDDEEEEDEEVEGEER